MGPALGKTLALNLGVGMVVNGCFRAALSSATGTQNQLAAVSVGNGDKHEDVASLLNFPTQTEQCMSLLGKYQENASLLW